jgi:hypothetical protein
VSKFHNRIEKHPDSRIDEQGREDMIGVADYIVENETYNFTD